MKHASLNKNYQSLSFELKIIFWAHLITAIFCFFPWFTTNPLYDNSFYYNAFEGTGFLIGIFIFVLSLCIALFFLNRLLEYRKIKLSFPEPLLYLLIGLEQLILLILMWSVLFSMSQEFEFAEVRFGFYVAFIAQIISFTAAFLSIKMEK